MVQRRGRVGTSMTTVTRGADPLKKYERADVPCEVAGCKAGRREPCRQLVPVGPARKPSRRNPLGGSTVRVKYLVKLHPSRARAQAAYEAERKSRKATRGGQSQSDVD